MKKLLVSSLIFMSSASVYAMDSNKVDFYFGSGVHSMGFTFQGYNVTSGKAHAEGLSANRMYNDHLELIFDANRSGSEDVAKDFYNASMRHVYGLETSSDVKPSKLNFYFYGEMTINGERVYGGQQLYTTLPIYQVYIAQGHNSNNNWWFGDSGGRVECSGYCLDSTPKYIQVVIMHSTYDSCYRISQYNGSYNKFLVSQADCISSGGW